jgi:hypothetical protein
MSFLITRNALLPSKHVASIAQTIISTQESISWLVIHMFHLTGAGIPSVLLIYYRKKHSTQS